MIERLGSDLINITKSGSPVLDPNAVYEMLREKGIRKFYQSDLQDSLFVMCDGHVASIVTIEQIIDLVTSELRSSGVTGIPQIMKTSATILSDYMMRANLDKINISPIRDGDDYGIFVFRNDIVVVNASGIHKLNKSPDQYFSDGQVVWKKDVIQHDIDILPEKEVSKAHFNEFLKCVAGVRSQDKYGVERTVMMYKRLVKSVGYLLHTFKKPSAAKAIIYMDYDSVMFEKSMGGTGKGIIVNAIDKLRPVHQIDGKRIDFKDRFVLSGVLPHHKVVALTDINKKFDFEMIFNWVTDMMPVENKFQSPYNIPFELSPKVVISTNYMIKGESDSVMRRRYDVILFNFFNKSMTVEDYFGHLFFHEWDEDEWMRFFNFMLHCLKYYLKNRNMSDDIASEEYKEMKMLNEIGEDLYSYFLMIEKNKTHKVKDLYEEFCRNFSKNSGFITQTMFSRKLADFAMSKRIKLKKQVVKGSSYICLETDSEEEGVVGGPRYGDDVIVMDKPSGTIQAKKIGLHGFDKSPNIGLDSIEPPF